MSERSRQKFAKGSFKRGVFLKIAELILQELFRFRGKKLLTETIKRTEKHTEKRTSSTEIFPKFSVCVFSAAQ